MTTRYTRYPASRGSRPGLPRPSRCRAGLTGERGPGSLAPPTDVRFANLGIYGWDVRDCLSYTAGLAATQLALTLATFRDLERWQLADLRVRLVGWPGLVH